MTNQRGKRPASQRGDFTGNQKEALLREHEEALAERREEIGLINATKQQVKDEGVIDLMDGVPKLDHPASAGPQDTVLVGEDADGGLIPLEKREENPDGERLQSSTSAKHNVVEVYELPEERVTAASSSGKQVGLSQEELNAPVTVRALYDLEEVTLGYGNTFDFKEGYRYRVPRWAAQHMEEKQLVTVLSLASA